MTLKKENKYNFISLFSGCGGFDFGFIKEGFICKGAFDIDPITIETHKKNLKSPSIVCDLSKQNISFGPFKNPDVVISGPPCQGFSTNGKRLLNDPRNNLLIKAGEIALELKPSVFILENVTGVTSGKHKKYWSSVQTMFSEKNYLTVEIECDSWKFGIPQTRKRKFLLAYKTKKSTIDANFGKFKEKTVRMALKGISDTIQNHNIKEIPSNSTIYAIAERIKPGQKLCNVRGGPRSVHTWDIPEVFGETTKKEREVLETILLLRRRNRIRNYGDADPVTFEALASEIDFSFKRILNSLEKKGFVRRIEERYDLTNTFNGKFRRLMWDGLSPTVHTRFGNPRYFLHPEENRGLTVREAARIQGFPDSFVFLGNENEQYRMVGNAVPPQLGRFFASFIRDNILK